MLSRGLNFLPGSKLEAKDFNEKWYAARVVETDWIEREVLIHFDKWSTRFDEWIPMDSSRLRISQVHSKESKPKTFTVGEKILATWVDGKKYPAKVNALLGNDKYDVLFDDGYSKILKTSKMTKLLEVSSNQPDTSAYVGSKQERRDKKRKHTVTELFYSQTKKKIKNDKVCKKQDLTNIQQLKYHSYPKNESDSNLLKTESEADVSIYQSVDNTDKIKKIKKGIYNSSSPEQMISKWMNKNSEENNTSNAVDDFATYIGNLRVKIEDSTYKCPKSGCNKNFRKENLVQMHIKHYHPEYSKFLGTTPNVADLAYARTIGESIEDVIPKKSKNSSVSSSNVEDIFYPVNTNSSFREVDTKTENKQNSSNLEDTLIEQNSNLSMSPDTLFDLRYKDDRSSIGIKTLPPMRQFLTIGTDNSDKLTLHSSDLDNKIKRNRLSDCEENDHSDNTLTEGNSNYPYTSVSDDNDIQKKKNNDFFIINDELVKVEKLRKEEIINCTCGIIEEDGLMIQCDLCLCWQHGHCNGIEKEKDVPEKYICYICQHSYRQRSSKKYFHDQDWIREGSLPILNNFSNDSLNLKKRSAMLKRSYDLITGLLQVQHLLHSLRVKINIALNRDHPKLYLWAKNWSKIEIPEIKSEPIPFFKIIKVVQDMKHCLEKNAATKLEISMHTRNENNQKLITSDTELMRILEEDNIQVEEPKSLGNNSNEGEIKDKSTNKIVEYSKLSEINHHDLRTKQEILEKSTILHKNKVPQLIIPEPEAPIDPVECKLRLFEHIDQFQNYVEFMLKFVETQLSAIENDNLDQQTFYNQHTHTKQTVEMLLNDLRLIKKLIEV